VSDSVSGTLAVIGADPRHTRGQVFNVGSDEEVSIVELARRIWLQIRPTEEMRLELVPYESFTGQRYEDVRRRVPNTSRLRALGWAPRVDLDEGLRRTIEWHRGH